MAHTNVLVLPSAVVVGSRAPVWARAPPLSTFLTLSKLLNYGEKEDTDRLVLGRYPYAREAALPTLSVLGLLSDLLASIKIIVHEFFECTFNFWCVLTSRGDGILYIKEPN